MTPKATVIITTVDRLEYLKEAVSSVRLQQDLAHELIVIDHESTDSTADWLAREEGLTSLRVHRDRSRSRAANISIARNAGLRLAHGEYVWFLDDDDRLRPGALSALGAALDRYPEAVVAVGARVRFGPGVTGGRIAHPLRPMVGRFDRELLLGWGFVPSQALCRRETLERVGVWGEEVPNAEDLDLWARLLPQGAVALVPTAVVDYRVHRAQSRLSDPAEAHDQLLRPHAAALGGEHGETLRDAGLLWERATVAFDAGESRRALSLTLRAVFRSPLLVRSPILRPLSTRMIVRSGLRCWGPTRRWVEARAKRTPAGKPRRGTGFLS